MEKSIGKYIFTQGSGVVVGLISVGLPILIIRKLKPSVLDFTNSLSIIVFAICVLLAFVFIMTLWGKVLIATGLLTKEEAKGYPYSKPWLDK
jgi:predicted permease